MTSQLAEKEIAANIREAIKLAVTEGSLPATLRYTVNRPHDGKIDINVRGVTDHSQVIHEIHREIAPGHVIVVREYTPWAQLIEKRLKNIVQIYRRDIAEDSDYGTIPNFYSTIEFINPAKGWAYS